MTYYIAAYDTEMWNTARFGAGVPTCLEAARRIAEVHRRYQMPATFFIVGRAVESDPAGYRATLDDPLFELASHTYSHRMLRDHPLCGPAASPAEIHEEIWRGKEVIEQTFGRPCRGLRSGCGFADGLNGAPEVVAELADAGYTYSAAACGGRISAFPARSINRTSYARRGPPRPVGTAGTRLARKPAQGTQSHLRDGRAARICSSRPSTPKRSLTVSSARPKRSSATTTASSSTAAVSRQRHVRQSHLASVEPGDVRPRDADAGDDLRLRAPAQGLEPITYVGLREMLSRDLDLEEQRGHGDRKLSRDSRDVTGLRRKGVVQADNAMVFEGCGWPRDFPARNGAFAGVLQGGTSARLRLACLLTHIPTLRLGGHSNGKQKTEPSGDDPTLRSRNHGSSSRGLRAGACTGSRGHQGGGGTGQGDRGRRERSGGTGQGNGGRREGGAGRPDQHPLQRLVRSGRHRGLGHRH